MSGTIYIDPNKVEEKAGEIENTGKLIGTTMEEVNALVKSLGADWQDEVQVDYANAFNKLKEAYESFSKVIPSYAAEARSHAETMRRIGKS